MPDPWTFRHMLASSKYSSYTNVPAGMGFLGAISSHLRDNLSCNSQVNPVYSLLIDEATDRTIEPHLIVYVNYLIIYKRIGPNTIKFVEFMPLERGTGENMFTTICDFMFKMHWEIAQMVATTTDGDNSMTAVRQGLVARLREEIPHLVGVHCIAHREALATQDANKAFPDLNVIN